MDERWVRELSAWAKTTKCIKPQFILVISLVRAGQSCLRARSVPRLVARDRKDWLFGSWTGVA